MSRSKTRGAGHYQGTAFRATALLAEHVGEIGRFAWAKKENMLVSPSRDGSICVWKDGRLARRLKASEHGIICAALSPNDETCLFGAYDRFVRALDVRTLTWRRTFGDPSSGAVLCVRWFPDGQGIVTGTEDGNLRIWALERNVPLKLIPAHSAEVTSLAWSPNGEVCASGSNDRTIKLWSKDWHILQTIMCPSPVMKLEWSPDGRVLAAATTEDVAYIWSPGTGRPENILEGHTDATNDISFSCDGRLLATRSLDNSVRIWSCDTWETVSIISALASDFRFASVSFHPTLALLAVTDKRDRAIRTLEFSTERLLRSAPATNSVHYANAKVVLVGDSGVGKSGLGLVLTGRPFEPTSSTHGRHVWTFDSQSVTLPDGRRETRETLLWDLAGQPGYRLIHQLHLNEVAVALLVFDARSDLEPFAGVRHWDRALRRAACTLGASVVKKILVEARIDRGKVAVSRAKIDSLIEEAGFDSYFATSAKDGDGVAELSQAIRSAIDWSVLPKVRSTELFSRIKSFLVEKKQDGVILTSVLDLFHSFSKANSHITKVADLRAQFDTCVGRVESRGLIRQLSFGGLVLLQPEFFDAYASAIVNAAREEPDGLGSVAEADVRAAGFRMSPDERLEDKEQEKLLLIATIEDLLRHEIALRETADDGVHLVFPSQLTRENPDFPDPEGKAAVFIFDGPVANIYATLVVRLSHSGVFRKKEMWKNATLYSATVGGICGVSVREMGEGSGELTLFFDDAATEQTRVQFEDYVYAHLRRRALPDTVKKRLLLLCPDCKTGFTEQQITKRRERDFDWIGCNVCECRVSMPPKQQQQPVTARVSKVHEIDRAADAGREREANVYVVEGKIASGDFDVFLCHNEGDKSEVKQIGEALKSAGILPWLDEWELRPGLPWQEVLEEQIGKIKAAAVFVGRSKREGEPPLGPWQYQELRALLQQFADRRCPVIPVVLRSCIATPKLPPLLSNMTWVDFRKPEPNPMDQLIWGITGRKSRAVKL